ncbi:hypothetical protein [Streptomyces ipomoeae]|uniref:hypothetical protein n=1 Tax=Streptomyces ipomoeae TaxID=103232 RepID=UPI0029A119F2|nr:hypothetical protein [Streptomyces ipomoeae]MDX2695944.1 hypothetical protein [Streptomyces ipomoeae]MDX2843374.1 hypothetical protein [Streptomyces ipomoeae]
MTASRHPVPPPDMGGLTNDWKRLQDLRREEAAKDRDQAQGAGGDVAGSGAPDVTEGQEHEHDQEQRPGRRPSRPGRTRGGRRPPPAAADAVPTTVRFDPEEASLVDRFILELRDDAARRTLDKAEVIRELLRLAREHDPTRRALLRRLR